MGRLIAVDYGKKRVGLAVTDPLKIIATPLETVATENIINYLQHYEQHESIEAFVVGMPLNLNSQDTDMTRPVKNFVEVLKSKFPDKKVFLHDERFTSKIALDSMIAGGTKKSYRKNKSNIDKISATLILQSFLERKH